MLRMLEKNIFNNSEEDKIKNPCTYIPDIAQNTIKFLNFSESKQLSRCNRFFHNASEICLEKNMEYIEAKIQYVIQQINNTHYDFTDPGPGPTHHFKKTTPFEMEEILSLKEASSKYLKKLKHYYPKDKLVEAELSMVVICSFSLLIQAIFPIGNVATVLYTGVIPITLSIVDRGYGMYCKLKEHGFSTHNLWLYCDEQWSITNYRKIPYSLVLHYGKLIELFDLWLKIKGDYLHMDAIKKIS